MNRFVKFLFGATLLAVMCTSCVTSRRVNYLQDMNASTQIELENKFEAHISPYDELDIYISSHDKTLSEPFNIRLEGASNQERNRGGYLVDVNGDIDMPVLGHMHVTGMTRLQLQDSITNMLKSGRYMDDAFVRVRFNNFKIFFLGADGGKSITISNERCTFLEALALSGDLSLYTRRDKIAVMREVDGKMVMRYLDPRSSKVFNDPFFMLQQNDFIITQSVNGATVRSEVSYWLSWVSTAFALVSTVSTLLLYNVVKK